MAEARPVLVGRPLGSRPLGARLRRAAAADGSARRAEAWPQATAPASGPSCGRSALGALSGRSLGLGASLLAWFPALVSGRRAARRARLRRSWQASSLARRAEAQPPSDSSGLEERKDQEKATAGEEGSKGSAAGVDPFAALDDIPPDALEDLLGEAASAATTLEQEPPVVEAACAAEAAPSEPAAAGEEEEEEEAEAPARPEEAEAPAGAEEAEAAPVGAEAAAAPLEPAVAGEEEAPAQPEEGAPVGAMEAEEPAEGEADAAAVAEGAEPPVVTRPRRPRAQLPIAEQYEDIKRAVEEQRVVVIVGGTGCGKSTQVPQYILDEAAAVGQEANVLVTQPRRMAAVTLARRVAEERGEQVGQAIGYRIRGETMPGSQLSFATAGYLLSWLTVEPENFASVTHIVLDEAHERDAQFELLILLVRLLMRIYAGPRLILMSATIESKFFSEYFKEFAYPRGATLKPLTVGSRIFPVEVFFLDQLVKGQAPSHGELPMDLSMVASNCMWEVFGMTADGKPDAKVPSAEDIRPRVWRSIESLALALLPTVAEAGTTILIFIPGYGDLCRMHSKLYWNLPMDTSRESEPPPPKPEDLERLHEAEELAEIEEIEEIGELGGLPKIKRADDEDESATRQEQTEGTGGPPRAYRLFALHSQVAGEDMELVLEPPQPGVCHVVLTTTIAESSLTLPQVCGVIDFGVHRTTCHDPSQPGLTQLRTQWCARSSLTQREGRAGRTRPGWCIRLVPQQFFEKSMPAHNTPEVLRTPLTTLLLQAKGISDGLTKCVQDDEQARRRLRLKATTPGELLMQLPAPPQRDAIESAMHQLAELGVLSDESANAQVTVLGRVALFLPLDVQLCRLVWLGALWGCAAEAVVLAAACSTPTPFQAPSRLAFSNADEFNEALLRSAESRRYFDGGHFSEPLMCLRLFCAWARRLTMTSRGLIHNKRWLHATESLAESVAVDESKMSIFVGYVADLAVRARDMCSDSRGENECRVRQDLHLLVRLLRRPDLSYEEQRERMTDLAPHVGEVFRAPASKLYALLAAAYSDQILVGKHRYSNAKQLKPMLDALDSLKRSGIASSDAILLPAGAQMQQNKLSTDDDVKRIMGTLTGEEPEDVASSPAFIACSYRQEGEDSSVPSWLRELDPAKRKWSLLHEGLPSVDSARLIDLATRPRLSFMSAGGLRRFTLEDMEMYRTVSPYELQFNLVHSSIVGRRMPGIFAEQNPLGFACHITSPEVPLGADTFAVVAANLTLGEAQSAVRANDVTLLTAEQMVYALTTLCLTSTRLGFAFAQGPGGSADGARAALVGVRLQKYSQPVMFRRHVAGVPVLDQVNKVRDALKRALVSPRGKNSNGQEVLLWEDTESVEIVQALVDRVEAASRYPELDEFLAEEAPVWVTHVDPGGKAKKGDSEGEGEGEAPELEIRALGLINVPADKVERQVANKVSKDRKAATHSFECPDCGERFKDWDTCLQHYEATCHLDVSSERAVEEAKELSKPVLYECPECNEGFFDWHSCKLHLEESGHLSWATTATARILCVPPDFEALEPEPQPEEAEQAEKEPEAEAAKKEKQEKKQQKKKEAKAAKNEKPEEKKKQKKAKKEKPEEKKQKKANGAEPEQPSSPKARGKGKAERVFGKSELYVFVQRLLRRNIEKGEISYSKQSNGSGKFTAEVSLVPLRGAEKFAGIDVLSFSGGAAKTGKDAEHLAAAVAVRELELAFQRAEVKEGKNGKKAKDSKADSAAAAGETAKAELQGAGEGEAQPPATGEVAGAELQGAGQAHVPPP